MAERKSKLHFYGGAESVTGANFLLEDMGSSANIMVDCGFFQGQKIGEEENRKPFPFDPKSIDALFITHAHIDHIGRIPKLVHEGFQGTIYSTPPTKEIANEMLIDSIGILTKEARHDNRPVIYTEKDCEKAMSLWKGVSYHEPIELKEGYTAVLKDAGHILGSSMIEVTRDGRKIVFTGDLGNSPTPLLRDTEDIHGAHYVLMESVYGDRNHESREERRHLLEDAIEDTVQNNGVLMVPAFSLERTQVLLYEINDLVENGRIPKIPVFLDSPLAIKITSIYKKSDEYFNKRANDIIQSGDKIFSFPELKFTLTTEESKSINNVPAPKVIIAGSGMSNGGRIIHHEKRYLPDPKSTLLLVGYQAAGSMGRLLADGAKTVKILGDKIPVRANIKRIHGYSAHKDQNGLLDFVYNTADTLEKAFLCMGEPKSSMFLAQRMRDYLGLDAVVPERNSSTELEL